MVAHDVAVIGGGVVGTAVAKFLVERSELDVCVLEKEYRLGAHQSGRNSGVIHPGFSYEPETLQARQATKGARMLKSYCRENDVPVNEDGILVTAKDETEYEELRTLHENGQENGVETELIDDESEIRSYEPDATGIGALYCPEGGSVDFMKYLHTLAKDAENGGAQYYMGYEVEDVFERSGGHVLSTSKGDVEASYVVNAAGLHADTLAKEMGVDSPYQIVPFRGVYYELTADSAEKVRSNIYPTPDPDYTSVGIHFTRRTDGKAIVGPNVALSFGREAYDLSQSSLSEFLETLRYKGFWNLMRSPKSLFVAKDELSKSYSKRLFLNEARELVPSVRAEELVDSYTGIVAKLVREDGELVDEQVYLHGERSTHILYVIPGLTSSMAIGEYIAEDVVERLDAAETSDPAAT